MISISIGHLAYTKGLVLLFSFQMLCYCEQVGMDLMGSKPN